MLSLDQLSGLQIRRWGNRVVRAPYWWRRELSSKLATRINDPRTSEDMEDSMKYYVGLDVSLKQTSVCIIDETKEPGSLVPHGTIPTTRL
jgi:hypothetical protein